MIYHSHDFNQASGLAFDKYKANTILLPLARVAMYAGRDDLIEVGEICKLLHILNNP